MDERFPATQSMSEMANDSFAIPQTERAVKQYDGLAPAGNADEVPGVRWKPARQLRINLNPIHFAIASNIRCPNMSLESLVGLDKNGSERRL